MFHLDSASPGGLLALSAILVATLIALPDRSLAAPGDEWTVREAPSPAPLSSVTWGDGRFVAVGDNRTGPGAVLTSPDGITWTAREAVLADWTSVARGNDTFVAVSTFLLALPGGSARDRVMTSPDGITWTPRAASANNDWRSIAWGNGTFVAFSDSDFGGSINDRVMTSPDGITWTNRTASAESPWTSVAYGNGVFVAVAKSDFDGQVMTSTDGVNWTTRTPPVTAEWTSVTWGGQGFVAVAESGVNRVMTSPDGITWTARTAASESAWRSVSFGSDTYVAVGGGAVMTSPDGIVWSGRTPAAPVNWRSVTAAPGMFVAVADALLEGDARIMTSGSIPGPPPPPPPPPKPTPAAFTGLSLEPTKRRARALRAPKKVRLTVTVANSGETGGTAPIALRSSARAKVRVPGRVEIAVPPGTTRSVSFRATVKPRRKGKVRITARVAGLSASATLILRR